MYWLNSLRLWCIYYQQLFFSDFNMMTIFNFDYMIINNFEYCKHKSQIYLIKKIN